MYTPTQVAKRAQVHPNSIRNWARDYADPLSPQASGEAGPRLFNDEDVQIFCTVAALRKSGMSPAEVANHLRNGTAPSIVDATPQQSLQQPTESLQMAQDAPLALYTAHSALQSRV